MEAKQIREMVRHSMRAAKNVYMKKKSLQGEELPPVRIINAREHKGFTQVMTISGRWIDAEFTQGAIYEQ